VVVVAGSPPYAGAAALCCASAGRSGAGIVSAALPRSIAHIVVGLVPEATVVLLPEGESSSVAKRSAEAIEERLRRSKSLVIGPGLGSDEATDALLGALFGMSKMRGEIGFGIASASEANASESVIKRAERPVVVDADALNWLAKQERWWERLRDVPLVLTPHAGEMARLMDMDASSVTEEPTRVASEAAAKWGQVVVLKGGRTVIADCDGALFFADASPALATAGSGDTLSGSIGAFLAQGLTPRDAAALAVYVGGRAADRLAARFGTLGVVAGDLPLAIAEELGALESQGV
jgi:NAD(P)H-hydrate repair Nnr-like enzyme with NAD(P)H-hydrate dehydratase domain